MWIVKIINYWLCVEWMIQYRKQILLQGMTKLQELDYLQRQLHTFPIHTNDAIQITFMISRERRADFCPFSPIENALLYLCYICVISPLYLCCLPGTGFLYNQSCDCVCDVMSDVPLYHATLWCPFYRCISHWSLSIKIHLSFIEPFASKWSPVLVWQAQIEL